MKRIILFLIITGFVVGANAQRRSSNQTFDTTRNTVIITSAYKPVLKPAAKINFSAPSPLIDTVKPALTYNIPAQNLFFTYQPGSLKPLALNTDNKESWINDNYLKAGAGNLSSFLADAGVSFGDGAHSLININGKHFSQKGALSFQQYAATGINVNGIYSPNADLEWRGSVGFEKSNQYYYGFRPDTLVFVKDSLRQSYNNVKAKFGLRNKQVNDMGISYNPNIGVNLFSDNRGARESSILINAPLQKVISEDIDFKLGITADITSLKRGDNINLKNNLYYFAPALKISRSMFTVNAGITPTWDNGKFYAMPNIDAIIKVKDKPFVLQAGFSGFFEKNTYQSLSAINPFIAQPVELFNTRIYELYGGLKGSAGNHLSYNARVGIRTIYSPALFVNDTLDGKTFWIGSDPKFNALVIHGEVGYNLQEKFSLLAGATINQFTNFTSNSKAWGWLPMELTGALRWQVLPNLQFKSDAFIWNGAPFFNKTTGIERTNGAFDLNAGATFTLLPQLHLWLQANNILNNKYQRWNQYQVVGLNLMGGIVYSFSQLKK